MSRRRGEPSPFGRAAPATHLPGAAPLDFDRLVVAEAAVRLLEGQPRAALQHLEGPAGRLRETGQLFGSLHAGLVACRAELALRRPKLTRAALRVASLPRFEDVPATPAVRTALAAVQAEARRAAPRPEFLAGLELWLVLASENPALQFEVAR